MGLVTPETAAQLPLVHAQGTAYLLSTAVFFAACAFAQLNDPDPVLWVALYAVAGVVFNLMLLLRNRFVDVAIRCYLCPMFIVLLTTLIVLLINQTILVVSADAELSSVTSLSSMGWLALEHESARDASGLSMVALHCMYLSMRQSGGTSSSPFFGVLMMGMVSSAAYMWYFHQADLNMRLKKAHCDGQMKLGA
eukprot:m.414464 g.414464  ORF g.414464 m.414464 type:complete len:194 (+) comp21271_c0_seq9:223-804(+)